jgi:hypothetical protein
MAILYLLVICHLKSRYCIAYGNEALYSIPRGLVSLYALLYRIRSAPAFETFSFNGISNRLSFFEAYPLICICCCTLGYMDFYQTRQG